MIRKLQPILFFALLSFPLHSTILYVDANVQGGTQDGSSWENAFPMLNSAIIAAQYGDTIWVAQGTYRPTTGTNRNISFTLKNGVKMFGGFTGTETSPDERDWETNLTILSGDIGVEGDSTDNCYNVIFCNLADSTTVLDGFIITGGNADSNASGPTTTRPKSGGGMYLVGSSQAEDTRPVIANCKFTRNYARFNGGGMFIRTVSGAGATPILINCEFQNNGAANGAGLYKDGGSLFHEFLVQNCLFKNNSATYGGGVSIINANGTKNIQINGCEFLNNYSLAIGSGLYHAAETDASMLEISDCIFQENLSDGEGSAIANYFSVFSTLTIDNCIFISNLNSGVGTIGLFMEGSTILKNSSFILNNTSKSAPGIGGCIAVYDANVIAINCLFSKSKAYKGSVAFLNPSQVIENKHNFINCSFVANEDSSGGVIYGQPSSPFVSIINSVFFKNSLNANNKLLYLAGDKFIISHCLSDLPDCSSFAYGPVTCGPGMLYQQDPHFTDTASGDFTLLPCSPAIEAGDNAILDSLGITTDLAGNPRILGGVVDMGAYEAPAFTITEAVVLQPSCGGAEGAVTFQVEHGCEPYSYSWNNGASTGTGTNGLLPGNYAFTITDAPGKTAAAQVTVPEVPAVAATATVLPYNCASGSGGSASVTTASGTGPFSYEWSTGDTLASAGNLLPGFHTFTVTDANGCIFSDSVQVGTAGNLALSITVTPIRCHDTSDGTAAITPLNGTAPFDWQWQQGQADSLLTGMSGGAYSVTVTDALGCTDDLSFIISVPDTLQAEAFGTAPACFGDDSGTASVVATGGTAPYTYVWNNAQVLPNIEQLAPGWYFVSVTDAHQCKDTASVYLPSPPAISLAVDATGSLCFGGSDGTAAAVISGGTPPYGFVWSTGQTDSLLTGLGPGSYTVSVTDANGCTQAGSADIQESSPIEVVVDTILNASAVGASDGAVIVGQVWGGEPPYVFLWSNGAATQSLEGVLPGDYHLTVTDADSCQQEFYFTVDVTVGLNEPEKEIFKAVIVPNPSGEGSVGQGHSAQLWIESNPSQALQVVIFDMKGRFLWEKFFQTNSVSTVLNLPDPLIGGVYIVMLGNGNGKLLALKWVVL